MSLRHGSFLAVGYDDVLVQASIRLLALALGRPNHYSRHLYALICACDVQSSMRALIYISLLLIEADEITDAKFHR